MIQGGGTFLQGKDAMQICVVGAGAIGGFMGAKLALAGEDVTLIARGPHLDAIRSRGITLVASDGSEHVAKLQATSDIAGVGPQDMVVLALKAHQIEVVASSLQSIIGPDTAIVTVQNGIPWWYFQKHGGEYDGRRLETLDPNGVLETHIDADRIIGCIAYPATDKPAPGVIRHVEGDRFPVGELDGSKSERVRSIAGTFTNAGFKSKVLTDIRLHIWVKLWGNLSFNPISALTRATLEDICRHPATRQLAADMMAESQTIAEKLGITFRIPIEKRIAGAEAVGAHKTSMLQDLEAGRPLEIEPLVGVVIELGRLTNTPTPAIDAVYACVKLLEQATRQTTGP
jgi:2-dehydropantoate 2-reductase